MAWVTPGMVAREISRRLGIILPTKCVGLVTSFRESDTAIPLTKARTGFDQRHIHIGGGGRDADRRDRRLGSGRCRVHRRGSTHRRGGHRSEEHTSELQSLMRISYAVFCLKKKINN